MYSSVIVAAGGALGSVLRYAASQIPLAEAYAFPTKTFFINIIGAFVIGIVASLAAKANINDDLALFLKVGVLGGFTTFSSFALETEQLIAKGNPLLAGAYVIASVAFSLFAVALAQKLF